MSVRPPRTPPKSAVGWFENLENFDKRKQKHTTAGIRWWSPTQLLIRRSEACVWQSGREAQFSSVCGRRWQPFTYLKIYTLLIKNILHVTELS